MKANFQVKLVADFDENISAMYYDDYLKSKLEKKDIEFIMPFGGSEYILIIKDKIFDK